MACKFLCIRNCWHLILMHFYIFVVLVFAKCKTKSNSWYRFGKKCRSLIDALNKLEVCAAQANIPGTLLATCFTWALCSMLSLYGCMLRLHNSVIFTSSYSFLNLEFEVQFCQLCSRIIPHNNNVSKTHNVMPSKKKKKKLHKLSKINDYLTWVRWFSVYIIVRLQLLTGFRLFQAGLLSAQFIYLFTAFYCNISLSVNVGLGYQPWIFWSSLGLTLICFTITFR